MRLPEKQYFTIPEIAKRWNCSKDDLFHYFEMEILHPAFFYKSTPYELYKGDEPGNYHNAVLIDASYITGEPLYFWNYKNLPFIAKYDAAKIYLADKILVRDYAKPTEWIHVLPALAYEVEDSISKSSFIITKSERDKFEKEYNLKCSEDSDLVIPSPESDYVNIARINELRLLENNGEFDLRKLLRLIEELNFNWRNNNYLSTAMLVRAIIDHVPPIFGFTSFKEVWNNYKGSTSKDKTSFKKMMENMDSFLRKVADISLHDHISKAEALPNSNTVNFISALDTLLMEIIKILTK